LHSFSVGTSHEQPWTHLTHHGPDSREATTFPHIIFFASHRGGYIRMTLLSRFGLLELWTFTTSCSDLQLGWGLKQSCSSPQELSNAMLLSFCRGGIWVDSQLLVVGSQIANLTPGPSFAHNLGCKCLEGSCEVILDIYTSRPFQRYKEHINARCFDPCNRALNFWESRRTPNSHFWECESHPHT
jgi:hypothetical protein